MDETTRTTSSREAWDGDAHTYECIRPSQRGPVALVRLSRPAKRNALNDEMIAGLSTFFNSLPEEHVPSSCMEREATFRLAPTFQPSRTPAPQPPSLFRG